MGLASKSVTTPTSSASSSGAGSNPGITSQINSTDPSSSSPTVEAALGNVLNEKLPEMFFQWKVVGIECCHINSHHENNKESLLNFLDRYVRTEATYDS